MEVGKTVTTFGYELARINVRKESLNKPRPRKNLNYDNPKNLFYKFINQKFAFAS